ncbi:Required for respiratory growth protein 9 mitochondrial [Peltigera leucophlebia]|nr:Required for respiratory growth protein 9 mitochondrial [Peltigera leucophlebia]
MSCHVRTTTSRQALIGFVPVKRGIWTFCKTSRRYYSRREVHPRANISPLSILGWESSRNSLIPPFQSGACQILRPRFLHNRKGQDIFGAVPSTDFRSSILVPDEGSQLVPLATETHNALSDHRPKTPSKVCLRYSESAETVVGVARPEIPRAEIVGNSKDCQANSATKFSMVEQPKLSRILHKPDSVSTGKNEAGSRVHTPLLWQIQKQALAQKFGSSGWAPRKRLSPDALEGIRSLHSQFPEKYTTPVLASHFQVSPEAIRRILKGKWSPNEDEEAERRDRWSKRGESIWRQMVEIGIKPPKKWRDMGLRKRMTRTVGMAAENQVSVREHLLGALRYRSIRRNSDAINSWDRPAPLSGRIL